MMHKYNELDCRKNKMLDEKNELQQSMVDEINKMVKKVIATTIRIKKLQKEVDANTEFKEANYMLPISHQGPGRFFGELAL